MIDIIDRGHEPTLLEIEEYIGGGLFSEMYEYLTKEYAALCRCEYSGDNVLLGWNVRFYKAGRTLCRVYPKKGYFSLLVVVGRREKETVEARLDGMSDAVRRIYLETPEGMGQRWLLIDVASQNDVYRDVLELIRIRRTSK